MSIKSGLLSGVHLERTGLDKIIKSRMSRNWIAWYRAKAVQRARSLAPVMRELQQLGLTLRGMAAELNKRKVETPRRKMAPRNGCAAH
jgi:hypothetical protein